MSADILIHSNPTASEGDEVHTRDTSMSEGHHFSVFVKFIFYCLGMSVLLPWNVLITATPYFLSRIPGESPLRGPLASYVSISYTTLSIISLGVATSRGGRANNTARVRVASSILIASMILLTLSPVLSFTTQGLFGFILANSMLLACSVSFLQTAVTAIAALFGPEALAVMFQGQAVVGIAVSTVQYISAASSQPRRAGRNIIVDEIRSTPYSSLFAFTFFGLAALFLALSLLAHAWLLRLPLYEARIRETKGANGLRNSEDDMDEDAVGETTPFLQETPQDKSIGVLEIVKANGLHNFAIASVFSVTLSVYPPLTSSITSVNPDSSPFLSPGLFISLHFLVFNVGDWFGRYLCSFPCFHQWSSRRIAMLTLLRVLFVPLFLACNVTSPSTTKSLWKSHSTNMAPLINSDVIYILTLSAFGISNGYCATMGMMAASSPDHNRKLKKTQINTAASVALFFLIGGLAIGSFLSFGVRAVICKCNPLIS